MITPPQCRAARALIDWSQQRLAEESNVGNATIRNFESGKSVPQRATMDVLKRAFESAGVTFLAEGDVTTGGPGVRLSLPSAAIS